MFDNIRADLRAHGGQWGAQGFWAMVVYRFGRWRYTVRPVALRKAVSLIYRIVFKLVQISTGIELPCEVEIGRGFVIDHFGGIVISGFAKFGDGCRIRNGVVVGLARVGDPCAPVIGNNVDIGTGAKLLGRITIGDNVRDRRERGGHARRARRQHRRRRAGGRQAESAPMSGARIGVVAIGRNEGERLRRCLESVMNGAVCVVYVDSGSTDGSAALAAELGASVVSLDMAHPFTAARARNEGAARLAALRPELAFIQFVDGDCTVDSAWLASAQAFLGEHADVAAVCGRRRERFPDRSIYNRLCDIEWNTPIGEAKACGGDVLMRAEALRQVGGYRNDLIAGEEPELCVRLRAKGWRIWRLDAEMTLHDAAITRLGQWWKRAMRSGHAYAEGARLHGAPPECHWVREARSALAWGVALPLAIVAGAALLGPWALLALAVYPLQVARLFGKAEGLPRIRFARAFFLLLGKFAEAAGELRFFARSRRGRPGRLIEYK